MGIMFWWEARVMISLGLNYNDSDNAKALKFRFVLIDPVTTPA